MSTAGIEVAPIRDMSGESHFNEVTFDDVDVAAWRLVGQEGRGWQQVLEQLAFERGGPERYLSSYALIHDFLDAAREHPLLRSELGRLAAQLATLRRVAWDVASSMDAGDAPIDAAVTLKFLGNRFESSVVEAARSAFGVDGGAGSPRFQAALLASPGFSIRGGAADVLLSLLARAEAR
jgi:acyl-CoA dehydrogenase